MNAQDLTHRGSQSAGPEGALGFREGSHMLVPGSHLPSSASPRRLWLYCCSASISTSSAKTGAALQAATVSQNTLHPQLLGSTLRCTEESQRRRRLWALGPAPCQVGLLLEPLLEFSIAAACRSRSERPCRPCCRGGAGAGAPACAGGSARGRAAGARDGSAQLHRHRPRAGSS